MTAKIERKYEGMIIKVEKNNNNINNNNKNQTF